MAFNYSPRIVTNGLVMYLDAGNQTSYVGNGTMWRDLTPDSNNSTLVNGPTFNRENGGAIIFDGVNDQTLAQRPLPLGNTFTVNAWVRVAVLAPNASTRRTIISNDYPYSSGRGFVFVASGNNGTDFWISLGNDQKVAVSSTGLISANTTYMLTARVNGTDLIRLYRNGREVTYASRTDGNVTLNYTTAPILGARNGQYDVFNGRMYNIQVYNRALTDAEILQNYDALKGRFII